MVKEEGKIFLCFASVVKTKFLVVTNLLLYLDDDFEVS